ncbi:folate-binding protein [Pseudooceanicola sediminis]|uniref:Folate-binding protein n=1 Tax=Pseudooceanicola sediminis TaxID=2211117 RepID=A0A399J487_9RHOB|nr:folate-binding protein YgfZ [Pseudooceanicola sediminis]KAA2311463.1 folate-binding protein YgfZ [Puniceibacterium sp. HSS470]RII40070.1 folate-binding protein [Pseudooceanicola sediminis]|tara:strand:- start:10433 stop:11212 length:780 start_codon:yes stop_codon:yes gene_type:complete
MPETASATGTPIHPAADARTILRLSGPEVRDFLQNLVTNDITRVDDGAVYAALLTPQGKYLADFLLVADGADILLDTASSLAPGLLQRLNMYKLRAKVTIAETDLAVRRGTGPAPDGAVADPRHAALGWRLYGATGGDDGTDWAALRVAHCIPETGVELTPDTFILEAGFERLHGVDFRKGCYVGQEVTARMKHKTELRKGLATVAITGSAPAGTEITRDGKVAGTLFTQAQGQAIAYLRFDRIGPDMTAGDASVSPIT